MIDWNEIISAAIFTFGGFISISLFLLALRIFQSDKGSYQQNKERSRSFLNVLRGKVSTRFDGARDFRIRAGLAVNKKNEWVEQGTLSEEAIDSVLTRK